jgi:hypothetical protein
VSGVDKLNVFIGELVVSLDIAAELVLVVMQLYICLTSDMS